MFVTFARRLCLKMGAKSLKLKKVARLHPRWSPCQINTVVISRTRRRSTSWAARQQFGAFRFLKTIHYRWNKMSSSPRVENKNRQVWATFFRQNTRCASMIFGHREIDTYHWSQKLLLGPFFFDKILSATAWFSSTGKFIIFLERVTSSKSDRSGEQSSDAPILIGARVELFKSF